MRVSGSEHQPSAFDVSDIIYAFFKHKWKILFCAIVGICSGVAFYFFYPAIYESNAKLLVRYVLERSSVDPVEARESGRMSENVLGSELAILTSWDLAMQVADAIGANRLVPGVKRVATKNAAAAAVSAGLKVDVLRGSNIILVSYRNRNPELTTIVLDELVNRYFNKHLEVHRSAGAFDFVTQQTDQVRARLNQTEDALKTLKNKAGIISLPDSMATLSAEQVKIQEQLHLAEQELAEQRARVKDEGAPAGNQNSAAQATHEAGSADVQQYEALIARLAQLRQQELDLLSKYTAANPLVKHNHSQIAELENRRRDLAKKFPDLPARVPSSGSSQNQKSGAVTESASLSETEAKVEALKSRLGSVQSDIKQLSDIGTQIEDLERNKELEEANYKYFRGTLEKARVDEALDPSKMPNISAVQRPSPPILLTSQRNKIALALAGGGVALGVGLALLVELLFNRKLKRSVDVEKRLGVSPLISIPYYSNGRSLRPPKKVSPTSGLITHTAQNANLAPWDSGHFIRSYCDALRDRVSMFFERNRMTHKPKLLGVTGFAEGGGTSTIATGLAASLSEMGDGKVLLVDVNVGHAEAHPFFRGAPALSLSTAVTKTAKEISPTVDNLYLATVVSPNAGPVERALKRFFTLMPNLKASDFDYIVFDMPPLTQKTPTLGMAGYMDMMVLVVDAEKDDRDRVKRGYGELVNLRSNVSVVLNKFRTHLPKWIEAGP